MHNNYYFLRQLSKELKSQLVGFTFAEIFSQVKDELILALYRESEEKYMRAHLDPSFCCLSFPGLFNRAKKNSVDIFPQLIGEQIADVIQVKQDRSFYLQTTGGFHLLFKMHGNRSNIILLKGKETIHLFKASLKQDNNINISELQKTVTQSREAFENASGRYKELIPTFGNAFDPYFKEKNYGEMSLDQKFTCLNKLLDYLQLPTYYIHQEVGAPPKLLLFKTHDEDQEFSSPIEAINTLFKTYNSSYRLSKEKSHIQNALKTQISKSESYILKVSEQLEKLGTAASYQHIGDLIMANMHLIRLHTSEVEVTDYYTQLPVKIKLKSQLSPQLNAEKYYKKSKKQQLEIYALKKNIEQKQQHVEALKVQLTALESATHLHQLEKEVKRTSQVEDLPYHLVSFMDFEILVGKNAKKNERLTFHIAKKDDLFLHAKDTPGSHVILKSKSKQNFPQPVIERAAALAAYFSKNKSMSLCNVLYTPKKYVRKAKGAPAGTVLVEREKVILVKPEGI